MATTPGGTWPGASPSTIAIRETLAETGIHCAIRAELGGRVHPLSGAYCQYFLCEYLAGTVENRDTSENTSAIFIPRRDLTRFEADEVHFMGSHVVTSDRKKMFVAPCGWAPPAEG